MNELIKQSINILEENGHIGTTLIQRKLKISYAQSCEIISYIKENYDVQQSRHGGIYLQGHDPFIGIK